MAEEITSRIRALEQQMAALDPGPDQRHDMLHRMEAYSDLFYKDIATRKTYYQSEHRGSGLLDFPIREEGADLDGLIELVSEQVDRSGLNPASGGHLGYIPGGGLYASALADYMADVGNNYAGVYFANPGAVRMENMLLSWMAGLVGYGEGFGGNLGSGGSICNLTAIVSARDAFGLKARDFHRVVIYVSQQAHHCIHKAIRISGLGEAIIRTLEIDEHFRIRPDDLAAKVKADKAAGLLPFLVAATAGTTDTGAVDPIAEISKVAKAEGLWLHVDAAYGGFFILCEEGRAAISGLELSDSIVMDPHKSLFLPYGLGAVLVKDRRHMLVSHYYLANYLQDAESMTEEVSPADVSPELTKHFRGLRMWLPLMLHGVAPFRAALSEKIWLCRHFHAAMSRISGIKVGPYPDLSVTMFRYVPATGDANAFNKKWMEAIHRDGAVFLSSTTLSGQVWIRMAIVSFRTHLSTIERAMEMLMRTLEEVRK